MSWPLVLQMDFHLPFGLPLTAPLYFGSGKNFYSERPDNHSFIFSPQHLLHVFFFFLSFFLLFYCLPAKHVDWSEQPSVHWLHGLKVEGEDWWCTSQCRSSSSEPFGHIAALIPFIMHINALDKTVLFWKAVVVEESVFSSQNNAFSVFIIMAFQMGWQLVFADYLLIG